MHESGRAQLQAVNSSPCVADVLREKGQSQHMDWPLTVSFKNFQF